MKHVVYLILILILPLNNLYSQSDNIEIYNEMFKWNFSISTYFENVSPKEDEKSPANGKEIIGNQIRQEIINKSIKIYEFKSGEFNQLSANYQPIKSEENYSERFKQIVEISYESLYESSLKKFPKAEITRSHSIEIISNITFVVFDMNISSNNLKMNFKYFNAIINGKILSIQVQYQDVEKGQTMISAFRKSTFKKYLILLASILRNGKIYTEI